MHVITFQLLKTEVRNEFEATHLTKRLTRKIIVFKCCIDLCHVIVCVYILVCYMLSSFMSSDSLLCCGRV